MRQDLSPDQQIRVLWSAAAERQRLRREALAEVPPPPADDGIRIKDLARIAVGLGAIILALLPVLTSTGRGSDVMVPMAIPSFGGMVVNILTLFLVPVLYAAIEEIKFKTSDRKNTKKQR